MLRMRFLDVDGGLPRREPIRHILVGQPGSLISPGAILAECLMSPDGRIALAQAMVEPIKISLEYQAIGRKLLMVDELPQGALPTYERRLETIVHTSLPLGRLRFVDVEGAV